MEKICCGGFYLGEGLELDGRTLKGTGGSGLPDPSSLPDGTALIKVGNEWKKQEGYGYTVDPAFEPITWDGNTDGREIFESAFCKVSDKSIPMNAFNGSKIKFYDGGKTAEINYAMSLPVFDDDAYFALYGDFAQVLVVLNDTEVGGMELHKGVYFMFFEGDGYTQYISELAAPSVHQFDSALIPASGGEEFVVKFSTDDEVSVTSDKTLAEIAEAFSDGKTVKCVLDYLGVYQLSSVWCTVASDEFEAHFLFVLSNAMTDFIVSTSGGVFEILVKSYTLTPAT